MGWPGHRFVAGAAALMIVVWVVMMALMVRAAMLPGEATGPMLVAFRPGTPGDEALARIVAAGGSPLRPTWVPFIWAVTADEPGLAGRLVDAGALAAFSELPFAPAPAGCVGYTKEEMFALRP
jgi:hypothetical protein